MSDITVVTGFFDIGRAKAEVWPRTNEQYFSYFSFWARLRNELIVYCAPQDAARVMEIRQSYGLGEKTTIVPIDDVYAIEPEMFRKMQAIEKDKDFCAFRYFEKAISNTARYDYVVMLKAYWLADAAKRVDKDCMMAWVDFGYNHGDTHYLNSEEFDFLWDTDFEPKVNAFCLNDPNKMSMIDSLQFQYDCFIGHTVIMPRNMCAWYWEVTRDAMESLLKLGCMDDDQQLQLMVYNQYRDKHCIQLCGWFGDFELTTNRKFTVRQAPPKEPEPVEKKPCLLRRIKWKLIWCYQRITDPTFPQPYVHPFVKRMQEKKERYYG